MVQHSKDSHLNARVHRTVQLTLKENILAFYSLFKSPNVIFIIIISGIKNVHCILSSFSTPVFIKLWSAAVCQDVRGGPQAVSEVKALQKLYQTLNE
jgi:hypothetical protein